MSRAFNDSVIYHSLVNDDVLMLSTMCGHGMVSSSLAKKMIDWVKEGRRTPEQAVTYLARFAFHQADQLIVHGPVSHAVGKAVNTGSG